MSEPFVDMYQQCAASLSVEVVLAVFFFTGLPITLLQLARRRASARRREVAIGSSKPVAAHCLGRSFTKIREANGYVRTLEKPPVFSSFVRTEANFVKANRDPSLATPPACPQVRLKLANHGLYTLWGMLSVPLGQRTICQGLAFGFFSAACSSLIMIGTIDNSLRGRTATLLNMAVFMDQIVEVFDAFKFYPTFLLSGFLTFTVSRWRTLLDGCFSIQGRLHDVSLHVGGALSRPEDPEARRFAWRVYRYLVVTHALCYAGTDGRLKGMDLGVELPRLGLLTADEWQILQPVKGKARDSLIAWIQADIEQAFSSGVLRSASATPLLESVKLMRGKMAGFHDLRLDINQPTAWAWLMTILVYTLIFLATVAFPAKDLETWIDLSAPAEAQYSPVEMPAVWCFHWWSLLQGFIFSACYLCSLVMIDDLQDPFDVDIDSFNVDGTMGSSEATLFATLRSRFDERPNEPAVLDSEEVVKT